MHRLLAFTLALLLLAVPASAWSYKEHILMTRLAAGRILADEDAPEGLKDFIREHCPEAEDFDLRDFVMNVHVGPNPEGYDGLTFWAMHPDFDRSTPVPAFDSTEGKMHYIDLELFHPDPEKRRYFDDLSGLPDLADIPRDPDDPRFKEAGFLPFRVEQCYNELVKAFRDGDDESAVIWAGYLAHYLQDNTQPHHATVDFRSHSYFEHLPKDQRPNVHGWMEYGFIDDGQPAKWPELRDELVKRLNSAESRWGINYSLFTINIQVYGTESMSGPMSDAVADRLAAIADDGNRLNLYQDPLANSLHWSFASHMLLPRIGEAAIAAVNAGKGDEAAGLFGAFSKTKGESVIQLKEAQLFAGVFNVEMLWRQAWAESRGEYERPPEAVTQKLTTRPARLPTRE